MVRNATIPELLARLREQLSGFLAVYRFGSSGTEAEMAGSDVDLAVYAAQPLPVAELWFVARELAMLAGRDVDLPQDAGDGGLSEHRHPR